MKRWQKWGGQIVLVGALMLSACGRQETAKKAEPVDINLNGFTVSNQSDSEDYYYFHDTVKNIGIYLNSPQEILDTEKKFQVLGWFEDWYEVNSKEKIELCGKEVSDDRSLTNLTLKMGYKTVMQDTSVIYTDAPLQWKKFLRQQLRWAEGSQYNNIRMSPWMFKHAKLMFFIYWSDMLLPFLLVSTYTNAILCFFARMAGYGLHTVTYNEPFWMIMILMFVGTGFGMGGRNFKALLQLPPFYLLLLPLITFVLSFVMAPLRILGLMKCADGLAWGTRVIEEEEDDDDNGVVVIS